MLQVTLTRTQCLNSGFRLQEETMKFFSYLFSLAHRARTTAVHAHDDNLRAGKETPAGLVRPGCWNSLLL